MVLVFPLTILTRHIGPKSNSPAFYYLLISRVLEKLTYGAVDK